MAKAKAKKAPYHYLQDKNGDLFLDCKQMRERNNMRKVSSDKLTVDDFETVEGPKATPKEVPTKLSEKNVTPETTADEGWE